MNKLNGWSNWETWNFMLWYGERLYDTVEYNGLEGDVAELTILIRDLLEEPLEGINNNFVIDMYISAIEAINIEEVIEALTE